MMFSIVNSVSDFDILCQQQKDIVDAVLSYDFYELRKLLDENYPVTFSNDKKQSLLHLVCKKATINNLEQHADCNSNFSPSNVSSIVYMLVDAGVDLELQDMYGRTCLFYAAMNKDSYLCEVLLQCGADMWVTTDSNKFLFDVIFEDEEEVHLQHVFKIFYPGLWKAVELEDIYQVRKLVNLWCKTDLYKNGKSLKDIAFDVGNEGIISLILGIFESMKMVYHILGKNTKAVRKMLETSKKYLRLDLRKMSERGAPILYYLIQSRDVQIIELFIKEGCQVYTVMVDEEGFDLPVLFTALKPDMSLDVIEALLPKNKKYQEEMLFKLLYKGKTVLEVALENNVSLEVLSVIVDRGGPLLVSDRNQFNQTVKELALLHDKKHYAEAIDQHIFQWISYPTKYPNRRQQMALFGWDFATPVLSCINKEFANNLNYQEYFSCVAEYQMQIKEIAEAVENGDIEKFNELKTFVHECDIFEKNLAWNAKVVGDGLPLLHRAVLFNHPCLVELILNEKPLNESIDKLFDQNHRTALHYAYAQCSSKCIQKLLLDNGCSEHVLDKLNKEPLDFREQQDSSVMIELLDRLKYKNTTTIEPYPWSENNEALLAEVSCSTSSQEYVEESYALDDDCIDDLSDSSDESIENPRTFCAIL